MTTVLVKKKKDGRYAGFVCTGHAGYGHSGTDIVCSAVSVLTINTVNAAERFAGQDMHVTKGQEDGVLEVCFADPVNEGTQLLMDAMVLGLQDVARAYGKKYLRLKFEEV